MGINELFDGIARVVERFAEEFAEQKLQEKTCLRREHRGGRCLEPSDMPPAALGPGCLFSNGGGAGSRTRVLERLHTGVYMLSASFKFSLPRVGDAQTHGATSRREGLAVQPACTTVRPAR